MGNVHEPGRFVTPSHIRRMYLRKNPSEPGCGVTTIHRIPFVGVVPFALNALNGVIPL